MMKALTASILLVLIFSQPLAHAWPAASSSKIFQDARKPLPQAMQTFLKDFEPVLLSPCRAAPAEQAIQKAIEQLTKKDVDPKEAVAAIRDAGCATAEMND